MGINSFLTLAWGLLNTGAPQPVVIDHFTSGYVQGIRGEDIGLETAGAGVAGAATSDANREPRTPVIVAVLDTGVDATHPALQGALALPGFNAIDRSTDVRDTHGHGTHVSGIIAARAGPSGFRGVSPNAIIYPVKVVQTGPNGPARPQQTTGEAGTALTETVAAGIEAALDRGAQVIQLSLAWPASIRSKRVERALARARQNQVLVVASAGNDSTLARVDPCSYEEVLCVGAHGPDGAFTHFSNHGPMVDLLAPGLSILSLWPLSKSPTTFAGGSGFELRNGTSMAAPFVSGAVAELLSRGIPPREVRSRLLLGARAVRAESLFQSEVVERASPALAKPRKTLAFGNLDIGRALAMRPVPFLRLKEKHEREVLWDGKTPEISLPITLTNDWATATNIRVRVSGQTMSTRALRAGESFEFVARIPISLDHESSFFVSARIECDQAPAREVVIPVSVARPVSANAVPGEAIIYSIPGLIQTPERVIRSVKLARAGDSPEFVVLSDQPEGVLLQPVAVSGAGPDGAGPMRLFRAAQPVLVTGFRAEHLYQIERLPDQSYSSVWIRRDPKKPRPSTFFRRFSPDFQPVTGYELEPDVTNLPENFRFMPMNHALAPMWVSYGLLPAADRPPFDPWARREPNEVLPRIYFVHQNALRVVPTGKTEIPLALIADGRVLASSGESYLQRYTLLTITEGAISKREELSLPGYRMLIGARFGEVLDLRSKRDPSDPSHRFEGSVQSTVVTTPSTPGSLRISNLAGRGQSWDRELVRPSVLDSLISVPGVYQEALGVGFFIEGQYDLWFAPATGEPMISTSMNRYSYLPSMVFSRGWFPLALRGQNQAELPALYSPASLANGNRSEVLVFDRANQRIRRPVRFRFAAGKDCMPVGNLVRAPDAPASLAFFCGDSLVLVAARE